jgi:hypothetical protein
MSHSPLELHLCSYTEVTHTNTHILMYILLLHVHNYWLIVPVSF